ncbi:MAG: transcriptional regulator GlxA family with amidase domain, partial [Arenicella sp.]
MIVKTFKLVLTFCIAFLLVGCADEVDTANEHISNESEAQFYDGPGLNVAFLIMDGTYNTELTAPLDIFHHTKFRDSIDAMDVFTIAESRDPITTFEQLRITPDFSYLEDYPSIDILVVPSAEHHLDSDLDNQELLSFIRNTDKTAQFMTSHCDGAFVLAEAGVLDGINCTTFPADIQEMKSRYSSPFIHDSLMFVHDGRYITSAGGAKSFEASLYLIEYLYGK